MKLILKETISTLGQEGTVVTVKPGYGRNYLLPQGKAVVATQENLAVLEENKAVIEARLAEERKQAEALSKKIAGIEIVIEQLAGDDERLFGSVTNADICAKLAEKNIVIDKKQIQLSEPIKVLGENVIPVKVGFQMFADVTVKVVRAATEA
ncbi:50S ribosomal protein L9 [Desulfopila aestuarii]|uniref:Large ribosomal subunit protein bL9 n=1 Tax=Desulfopila aestuarii DSM 18488 TaxID=1121416 RepID=A0A1M7Y4D5_9BACT|nr:50S ribosomal protein L9 [Desulfopila aestuarii]SHO46948.1 LSU ribosomal protein L9P [Desulfopila aestuarii DSM 18488]